MGVAFRCLGMAAEAIVTRKVLELFRGWFQDNVTVGVEKHAAGPYVKLLGAEQVWGGQRGEGVGRPKERRRAGERASFQQRGRVVAVALVK